MDHNENNVRFVYESTLIFRNKTLLILYKLVKFFRFLINKLLGKLLFYEFQKNALLRRLEPGTLTVTSAEGTCCQFPSALNLPKLIFVCDRPDVRRRRKVIEYRHSVSTREN